MSSIKGRSTVADGIAVQVAHGRVIGGASESVPADGGATLGMADKMRIKHRK